MNKLLFRKLHGIIFNWFYPGFGGCYCCERKWPICKYHSTMYELNRGCFPLCQTCWGELNIKERLPYYERLIVEWENWNPVDPETVVAIRLAVESGL